MMQTSREKGRIGMTWRRPVASFTVCIALGGALAFCGCADRGTSTAAGSTVAGSPRKELAEQRYQDPNGYFSIIPPAGWRIQKYPGDPRGKVAFHGPQGAQLRILVSTVGYSDFDTMLAKFREKKRQLSGTLNMDLETLTFQNRRAVKKAFAFRGTKFVAYDFMVKNVHHDLQYGAPSGQFNRYLPLVKTSMETYEPRARDMSPAAAKRAAVAKRLRLARLFLNGGNVNLARQMVREGLELDPGNLDLQRLNRDLPGR